MFRHNCVKREILSDKNTHIGIEYSGYKYPDKDL